MTRPLRIAGAAIAATLLIGVQPAQAIGTDVDLGTATSYSVLGGQSVTNTGPTVLSGDLGVNPGTAISGFPPGTFGGVEHRTDAHSLQAQSDLTVAYNDAAGQAPDASVAGDLGGLTLSPGVYNSQSTLEITGPLTLDAQGDPDAVFIFQVGSSLTTATDSSVVMLNGASSCNVYWQVGESATIGTGTDFIGTVMALTSITVNNGATVTGRALARNGSVTLDNNVFTDDGCGAAPVVEPEPTEEPTVTPTQEPTAAPTGPTEPVPTPTPDVVFPPVVPVPTPTPEAVTPPAPTTPAPEAPPVQDTPSAPVVATPDSPAEQTQTLAEQDAERAELARTGASTALLALAAGLVLAGVGLVAYRLRTRGSRV